MADEGLLRDVRATKLTKATYNRWKIEIRDVLESHRIWEIAARRTTRPNERKTQEDIVSYVKEIDDWKAKDSNARSVIRSTIDDTTFNQICDCEASADIMNRIKAV